MSKPGIIATLRRELRKMEKDLEFKDPSTKDLEESIKNLTFYVEVLKGNT